MTRWQPGYRQTQLEQIAPDLFPGEPCVYFLGWVGGPIKIGFARNLRRRWQEIQIASPFAIVVWAAIPGSERDERQYHHRFRHLRLRGEWFERSGELEDEISLLSRNRRRSHLLLVGDKGSGPAESRTGRCGKSAK